MNKKLNERKYKENLDELEDNLFDIEDDARRNTPTPNTGEQKEAFTVRGPSFMGGSAYYDISPGNISVTFFAQNKKGSENNKYAWYEDADVNKAEKTAHLIAESLNNYASTKAENESLKEKNAVLLNALKPFINLANEVFIDTRKDKEGVLYAFNNAEITYDNLRDVINKCK